MDYDENLWNQYTEENKDSTNPSDFIYHMALGLGAKKILEIGCNIGNNLTSFPNDFQIHGIDLNKNALQQCEKRMPNFTFKHSSTTSLPYDDSFFDLVFSRTVLIHIDEHDLEKTMQEMLRVSKKWIFNMEFFNEDENMINWKRGDNLLWYRNLAKRWEKFNVRTINSVQIPKELDPDNVTFTLIEKL